MKIAVFAHDAGASEILLELIKASVSVGEFRIFSLKDSPCYKLVMAKELAHLWCEITPENITQTLTSFAPSWVLYGTGWQNHLEYDFLAYAKANTLPSVAFLDHWTNYKERFGYPQKGWEEHLPSFIATHDPHSYALATKLDLPHIIGIKNYALLKQLDEAKSVLQNTPEENRLLFLSEPTTDVAKRTFNDPYFWGFTEKEVFEDILNNKALFHCDEMTLRLHPSDTATTYQTIDPSISLSQNSLIEDIAKASIIIGIDTVALYTAFLLGKKVISYVPSNKRHCSVPLQHTNQLKTFEGFELTHLQTTQENPCDFGMDFASFIKKH